MTTVPQKLRILTVCTANICRSPAAAALLRQQLEIRLPGEVVVMSAGVATAGGSPPCELSAALVATYPQRHGNQSAAVEYPDHLSVSLPKSLIGVSDLILALDRSHRATLARKDLSARPRTFTLRQAADIARRIQQTMIGGELPEGAPLPPSDPLDRMKWLITELDAGRAARSEPPTVVGEPQEALAWHPDDVPDPHIVGYHSHAMTVELIEDAVTDLMACVDAVLAFPITTQPPVEAYDR